MPPAVLTVRDALRHGAERLALREDLRDYARQDAQQLLEIATGLSRVQMLARPEAVVESEDQNRFEHLLERRLEAVPIQYLRGSQQFYGRTFRVTPDVLIPRPETEDIVTAVLERVADRQQPISIADVGTGSGAIAVTLALELPGSRVTALDISAPALRVARQNAAELGRQYDPRLPGRIGFNQSDLFAALPPGQRFDVVVSNPPYIPLGECDSLHRQVKNHEPHQALFGGEDGNDVFRRMFAELQTRLTPRGLLVLETSGTNDGLHQLLSGWKDVVFRRDLAGHERIVVASLPE